ncbi:MAG: O-antigen ligase family protein [Candidatus Hydrogenedentes bacterium]|nr:O-antigen ligase family protein [Candidatus Hydrogenedentota bacterium]
MSKRIKQRPAGDPRGDSPGKGTGPADARAPWWTEDFARPRVALLIGGVLAVYSVLMFLFLANGVMAVDRAAVLWAGGCIIGLGIIHPALALALLAFVRHWIDGMTYPSDNTYFLWAILYLFTLWALRILFRGGRIRFAVPTLLLGGFTLVAFLTTFGTVQYDNSFDSLLMWCSYLALFVVAANTLRAPLALTIALAGVMAAFYAQAAYSILHYDYVLPYVRKMILEDPALLRQYFNTDQLTPELARRLARNRAFGTMLFPNALAALLILGLPACYFGIWFQWRKFRGAQESRPATGYPVVATAAGGWFIALFFNFAVVWFHSVFSYPNEGVLQHPLPWIGGVGLAPLAAGAVMAFVAQRKSGIAAWRLAAVVGLGVTAVAASIALFLSVSRGGMLGLGAAVAWCGILIVLGHRREMGRLPGIFRKILRVQAAVLLVAVGAAVAMQSSVVPAAAQEAAAPADAPAAAPQADGGAAGAAVPKAQPKITEEGVNLDLEDMLGTSSMSIRLTYWNVALRMAFGNFFTGVGIGNFGVAYPRYQFLGAGDVQTAHNDYLQYFAETGIFGFLFFCAFSLWFAWWGARRIVVERTPLERWMLAGLYGGVIAFLLHSAVDFNFNNPALVFFAMLLAGAFCARASAGRDEDDGDAGDTLRRGVMIPALLIVALVFGMSLRTYYQDFVISKDTDGTSWLNLGNYKKLDRRYAVATFFLLDGPNYNRMRKTNPQMQPPVIPTEAARLFVPTRKEMEPAGELRVPLPGNRGSRPVNLSEPLPDNAVLVLRDAWAAYLVAKPNAEAWVQRLIAVDSVFPHSPELADHIAQWYALFWNRLPGEENKRRPEFQRQEIAWRREAVERSPLQPGYHIALGRALWDYAEQNPDADAVKYYDEGFQHYAKALEIYPISLDINSAYASGLHFMGYAYGKLGDAKSAAEFEQRAEDQEALILRLAEARAKAGLP